MKSLESSVVLAARIVTKSNCGQEHSATVSGSRATLRKHRALMGTVPPIKLGNSESAKASNARIASVEALEIQVKSIASRLERTAGILPTQQEGTAPNALIALPSQQWLMAHGLGTGKALELACSVDAQQYDLKLLPWGGVAARIDPGALSRTPDGTPQAIQSTADSGRTYVFLPLPLLTGLPVHVNGFFEISENRRELWLGTDMKGAGLLRAKWNALLVEDAVCAAYVNLIVAARQHVAAMETTPSAPKTTKKYETSMSSPTLSLYHHLFPLPPGTAVTGPVSGNQRDVPTRTYAPPWDALVRHVYKALYAEKVAWDGIAWSLPRDVVFFTTDESNTADAALPPILLVLGMRLCVLPAFIVQAFTTYDCNVTVITPQIVRTHLKRLVSKQQGKLTEDVHRVLTCAESVMTLLRYVTADKCQPSELIGTPLGLCASGDVVLIQAPSMGNNIYLCTKPEHYALAQGVKSKLMHIEVTKDAKVRAFLLRLDMATTTNIKVFDHRALAQLLPLLLPPTWRQGDAWIPIVEPGWDALHISEVSAREWVQKLWKYLRISSDISQQRVRQQVDRILEVLLFSNRICVVALRSCGELPQNLSSESSLVLLNTYVIREILSIGHQTVLSVHKLRIRLRIPWFGMLICTLRCTKSS